MSIEEMIQEMDYQATEDIFLDEDGYIIDDYSLEEYPGEVEYSYD